MGRTGCLAVATSLSAEIRATKMVGAFEAFELCGIEETLAMLVTTLTSSIKLGPGRCCKDAAG